MVKLINTPNKNTKFFLLHDIIGRSGELAVWIFTVAYKYPDLLSPMIFFEVLCNYNERF